MLPTAWIMDLPHFLQYVILKWILWELEGQWRLLPPVKDELLERVLTSRSTPNLSQEQVLRFSYGSLITSCWYGYFPYDWADHNGRVHQKSSARKVAHQSTILAFFTLELPWDRVKASGALSHSPGVAHRSIFEVMWQESWSRRSQESTLIWYHECIVCSCKDHCRLIAL